MCWPHRHPRHVLVFEKYLNDLPKCWKSFVSQLKEMTDIASTGSNHLGKPARQVLERPHVELT